MKALKKYSGLLIIAAMVACISPSFAQDKREVKEIEKEAQVKKWLDTRKYTFKPTSMHPARYGYGNNWTMTSDYSLDVRTDTVSSYLPFFGRAYTAVMGGDDQGIKFVSSNVDYTAKESKKNRWDITIKPKNSQSVSSMILRVFANGEASLSVNSNNRESISFQGYITGK
ncbi:DUF4251 domain-containing protein [Hufsiella ginkgonis]|uniref:DUF4251 domain-containing protein n=1 Tax=Hufsiella ginkgonis TaxID=2695274 RepID=A0A7K1XS58_9SPHI|nr:DUF4251 domain-containing protein [Hufsiella ginkgonis]MXV13832.1 DUF4251 domain-containing protein [Hufsiella ginkgonis]